MKNFALYFAMGFFLLTSCQSDPKTPAEKPEAPTTEIRELTHSQIRLICSPTNDPNQEPGYPQNEVFLYLAESKVKIADILACESITPNQFKDYDIPKRAIAAVGGWWAGAGDYVYVVEEGDNFVVKKGELFEEQDNNSYNYKTVMTFTKEGEEVF